MNTDSSFGLPRNWPVPHDELVTAGIEAHFAPLRAELDAIIASLPWYARAAIRVHVFVMGAWHKVTRWARR